MRPEGIKTRIENSRIDNTIELAKVALCLRHFQDTGSSSWFDRAVKIATDNEFYRIVAGVADPDEFVFGKRERFSECSQLHLF